METRSHGGRPSSTVPKNLLYWTISTNTQVYSSQVTFTVRPAQVFNPLSLPFSLFLYTYLKKKFFFKIFCFDLSFLTRDGTCAIRIGRAVSATELPGNSLFNIYLFKFFLTYIYVLSILLTYVVYCLFPTRM